MTRASTIAVGAFITLFASTAHPQAHPHRAAPDTGHLGAVHFETTCASRGAAQFDRAMALLHSFEFGASIRAFDQVLALDSACAMAHWGIALSLWGNPLAPGNRSAALLDRGRQAAAAAARLGAGASARERAYIRAVGRLYEDVARQDQATRVQSYERAMHEVARKYRDDSEATILHALALVATAAPGDKTYSKQLEAGRTLEALWASQPDHPGLAHYIIHTYDHPPLAGQAREAARRYARIAPAAAHALHMPSHTFTRVGWWEESVNTNMRSMKVAQETGSIAEALHAADYAVYANLQLGRLAEAKALIDRIPALAERFDPTAVTGAAPGSAGVFALAAMPARWVLERRAWSEAAALEPATSAFPYAEAMTWFARALGAARTGDVRRAREASDSLAAIRIRLAASGEAYWAEQVAIQHLEAEAWLALGAGREERALAMLRQAVAREDATAKSVVTPGPVAPARELLGDMLVELGRADEAIAEYRAALRHEPNRRHASVMLASLGAR